MTVTAYTLTTSGVTNAGESLTKERVEFCVVLPNIKSVVANFFMIVTNFSSIFNRK